MNVLKRMKFVIKWLAFWWCFAGIAVVTGCATAGNAPSGSAYPEYNKWWTRHPVEEHVDEFGVRTYTQLL